jgi:selenocysteine-specific elongation factor
LSLIVFDRVLGTAGHIDHGKTALVRALTGIDTDRLPAEKQRGITIDLGFASLQLGEYHLALIDVPGHERFIRNMLAGATGLDLAMLVVAADDSVMPQTREHLEILRLLGLSAGVIALTKCDLADQTWLDLVEEDVRALVSGTFLEGAAIVRTSAVNGAGIAELKIALETVCTAAPRRHDAGVFRMAIDRSFSVAGHGTVVTGTIASGTVAVGDEVVVHPEGRLARVRGLHRHDQPVETIGRGSRAAINLTGVHHTAIRRGNELTAPGYVEPTRVVSVEITESEDAPRPMRHRGRYKLHVGTAEVSAVLSILDDAESNPAGARLGQLFMSEPVVAVHGQPFVLRAESPPATVGGGHVLEPWPRRLRRRDRTAIARLGRLRSGDPIERLTAVLASRGLSGCTERQLSALTGRAADEVEIALAALSASGKLVELSTGPRRTVKVLAEVVAELEDRVLRALARLHELRPRQSSIPRGTLATALADLPNPAILTGLLERLEARTLVLSDQRTVALHAHSPKLSQGERKLKAELAELIRAGGISPPDLNALTAQAGSRQSVAGELLALLRDEQKIVEISPELFLDFDVESELRRTVAARLAGGAAITMSELRELLGTTRKYAVPIGEYLDRIGLTRREGDLRRLGSAGSPPEDSPEATADLI